MTIVSNQIQHRAVQTQVDRHVPLVVLVVVNLIIGFLTLPGYGESMDELMQHDYGQRSVRAVEALVSTGTAVVRERPRQGSHGPAFIMTVIFLKDLFLPAGTLVEKLYFSHFLYFIMFQVGVVSLFFLARRWVGETAAFGTALLFSTQPLFVGHAFINPKDVVFMSLLIANAVLGLRMVDREDASFATRGRLLPDLLRSFFRQFLRADVWLAGFLLGFTSAIRIAAPLIGIILLGEIIVSRKWQRLPRLVAYGLIAVSVMFLFWPYLWADPIGRLIEVILNSANYPDVHWTLFRGTLVEAQFTPRSYLPVLLAIQLTEPALLLLLLGSVALLRKLRRDLIMVLAIWFVFPVLVIVGLRVHLYNNFRQLFFLLPPLFLIAGLGLEWLFTWIRRPIFRDLILVLSILPALYANVNLYPYQYVYYNQLAGGLRGAYRVFELDYWQVAFREAQLYVNKNADRNANIFAGGAKQTAQTFARSDLVFNAFGGKNRNRSDYDYLIVSTAQNEDEQYAALPTVFVVERDGVPLALVKKPR